MNALAAAKQPSQVPFDIQAYSSNSMIPDVDIFISNYTLVDPEVYQLWVDGCSCNDAVETVHKNVFKNAENTLDLVRSDVFDHYRTYNLLEKLLHNPPKLAEQLHFQIEPQTRQLLIEKYYEFNDCVVRELLGKKLSSRYRKDLDEVSDKTNISLKSCRRQFDNVKRVFKAVEDLPGSVVDNIRNLFLLSEDLAKRYSAVVFMGMLRLETSKKKLQHLSFCDLYACSLSIMAHWTYPAASTDHDDMELDREFLLDLRETRLLLDKEKELKHLVCGRMKPLLLDKTYQEFDCNFRNYSRVLVNLAVNLHRSRELRGFLLDLVEKCVEPWRAINMTSADVASFLHYYKQGCLQLDILRESDVREAWERYMTVLASCVARLYPT